MRRDDPDATGSTPYDALSTLRNQVKEAAELMLSQIESTSVASEPLDWLIDKLGFFWRRSIG
jgi:hypothetical protein